MKEKLFLYKKYLFLVGVLTIIGVLFLVENHAYNKKEEQEIIPFAEDDEKVGMDDQHETAAQEDVSSWMVDVKGEVAKPGVYVAKQEDRIQDIIILAGGLTKEADLSQINLAMRVADEMIIYIPKIGEVTMQPSNSPIQNKNNDGRININQAMEQDLLTLPGIGPSKAAAIIEYREENGLFSKIEDLQSVNGIGEKTFEKLKEHLTVQ